MRMHEVNYNRLILRKIYKCTKTLVKNVPFV